MSGTAPAERFLALWGEIANLKDAAALLSWDQETHMPQLGHAGRASVQSTLAGLRHAKLCSSELHDALESCAEAAAPGSVLAAQVREARRIVHRVSRIPERLARERAEARTLGKAAWVQARAQADFTLFRRELETLVRLAREEASALAGEGQSHYEVLIDEYEPGARESALARLFADLRQALSPLVRAVADSGKAVDERAAQGNYPAESQLAFGRSVAEQFGFEFTRGRIDRAPHPFCTGFGPGDVRLTWRPDERDFRPGLYGILHETGHGLYEQGLPEEWQRTPLGDAPSVGLHESQSRLWENLVGRSRAFWTWALPRFQASCPAARGLTLESLLPLLHTVRPSLVRVEADQGTYDLHVCVRFELERALFAGELEVSDLPRAWDEAYVSLLGLRPRHAAEGVLQDIHWAMGAFGYFPTYTLGNLIAAQLFARARADLGDLDGAFARGDFRPLLEWLRKNIHRHGAFHSSNELLQQVTGFPLSSAAYLELRHAEACEFHGVTLPTDAGARV